MDTVYVITDRATDEYLSDVTPDGASWTPHVSRALTWPHTFDGLHDAMQVAHDAGIKGYRIAPPQEAPQ